MTPLATEQQALTREQVIEKYGNVRLKFSSYYKYSFTYVGTAEDGVTIACMVGGDSDSIYRYSVDADSTTSLVEDQWNWACVNNGADSLWVEDRR